MICSPLLTARCVCTLFKPRLVFYRWLQFGTQLFLEREEIGNTPASSLSDSPRRKPSVLMIPMEEAGPGLQSWSWLKAARWASVSEARPQSMARCFTFTGSFSNGASVRIRAPAAQGWHPSYVTSDTYIWLKVLDLEPEGDNSGHFQQQTLCA